MRKLVTISLGLALVTGLCWAQKVEVRKGDTLERIAARNGVTTKDLEVANGISRNAKIKPGQMLTLPKRKASASKVASKPKAKSGNYSVRNGDNDWSIAARFGITSKQLRLMNPEVDWKRLQIGQALNVPGSNKTVASKQTQTQTKPATTVSSKTHAYRVKSGDNDWIIARRHNTTVAKLRSMNPGVQFDNLKIGIYVRVPGSGPAPQTAAAAQPLRARYGVIAKDGVIVRRGASTSTEKVVVVPKGTEVTILDRQGEWYKLRFPRGTVGWVRGDMLKARSAPAMVASIRKPIAGSSKSTVAKSSGKSSRVATRPSKSSQPSTRVASTTRSTGRYVGDGDENAAVSNAMNMVGTRYRYGAMSRSATDCSGMVKQAYGRVGVNLPRTSREMANVGKPVSKTNLQPGDLVFFKTRGSRISHVGIYKGNGKFVHASSGQGRVTVSDLNGGYYQRNYAGARRVTSGSKSSSSKKSSSSASKSAKVTESKPKVSAPIGESNPTKGTDEIAP